MPVCQNLDSLATVAGLDHLGQGRKDRIIWNLVISEVFRCLVVKSIYLMVMLTVGGGGARLGCKCETALLTSQY